MKLLLIGNRGGTNIGACFELAAESLGVTACLIESRLAMEAPATLRRLNWRLCGRRPTWLHTFSANVVDICQGWRPDLLLATGVAPLSAGALDTIRADGIYTANYLTDDPWNPAHRAPWFLGALPAYTCVLTPRRANIADLRRLGCREVRYLPFGYMPELHYPEPPIDQHAGTRRADDIVFVGAGDSDRVPFIAALAEAGVQIGLYGSFWERFPKTRALTRGQIDVPTLRRVTSVAPVALVLVRQANRDGHVMRSFEIPAIGACMLVEDTAEHREIFGTEGEAVVYFTSPTGMVTQLRWLLDRPEERQRLALAAHRRIVDGNHTYRDRLLTILNMAGLEHTHMTAGSIGEAP